jgi:hypothetical protein
MFIAGGPVCFCSPSGAGSLPTFVSPSNRPNNHVPLGLGKEQGGDLSWECQSGESGPGNWLHPPTLISLTVSLSALKPREPG